MKVPPLLALLAYTAMLSCTGITDPVAGTKGGSETTNGTVVGLLVDENGMAVDSAVVQLSRTLDWNEASLDTGTRMVDTTDTTGTYRFTNIPFGDYDITGRSRDSSLVSLVPSVSVSAANHDRTVAPDTMKQPARLHGIATIPHDHTLSISLPGTPYMSRVDSDSSFKLSGIKPGTYTLRAIAENKLEPKRRIVVYRDTIILTDAQDMLCNAVSLRKIHSGPGPVVVGAGTSCTFGNEIGGTWWGMNDVKSNGSTTIIPEDDRQTIDQTGDPDRGCAAHLTFTFGDSANWLPYAGIGTNLGLWDKGIPTSADLRDADSLTFLMKGSGTGWLLRAEVHSGLSAGGDIRLTIDSIPGSWTRYRIDFSTHRVGTFTPDDYRSWDNIGAYATRVVFQPVSHTGSTSGDVWIDDVTIWFSE